MKVTVFENTATSAKYVAECDRDDIAAISSPECAKLYGLQVMKNDIQNNQNNYTRFICIAKDMEIFGPVVPIIGFDSDEEAIEIANSSIFGLSSCVLSSDQKRAFNIAKAMESGGAVINGASFFRSFEMPFGGWKHSGIGTEGVMSTFDEMTRVKNIVLKNIVD